MKNIPDIIPTNLNPGSPQISKQRMSKTRDQAKVGPYILGKTLGVGATGRVKLGVHYHTGDKVAIKMIGKEHFKERKKTNQSDASSSGAEDPTTLLPLKLEREITIMKMIRHPNVLQIYDVYETSTQLFLVLEHVEGGELFDFIVQRGRLQEPEALRFFQQIIFGVNYCHLHLICHRDLKPENLLLDGKLNIKIADFGMASLQREGKLLETSCGSPHYASPEVIRGVRYQGAAADIWSCGVILYALLTGTLPFDHENVKVLLQKVKSGVYQKPEGVNPLAVDLISKMLEVNPEKRIKMADIIAHAWFNSIKPNLDSYYTEPAGVEAIERVANPEELDTDVLKNLQLLGWRDQGELIDALTSEAKNKEKIFYYLLLQRKKDYIENYSEDTQSQIANAQQPRRRTESFSSALSEGSLRSSRASLFSANSIGSNNVLYEETNSEKGEKSQTGSGTTTPPTGQDITTATISDVQAQMLRKPARNKPPALRMESLDGSSGAVTAPVKEKSATNIPVPVEVQRKLPSRRSDVPQYRSDPTLFPEQTREPRPKTLAIGIPSHLSAEKGPASASPTMRSADTQVINKKNQETPPMSPLLTSSPKRSWLATLFNFKPETSSFYVREDFAELNKNLILKFQNLSVSYVSNPTGKSPVAGTSYKCKYDPTNQLASNINLEVNSSEGKGAKFRLDILNYVGAETQNLSGWKVNLVHIQGSTQTFHRIANDLHNSIAESLKTSS